MKNKTLFVIAFGLLTALPSGAIASELESLQGKWESRFQEHGKALRVLKIIDKNRETVETYDGDRLVHRHVVSLEEKVTVHALVHKIPKNWSSPRGRFGRHRWHVAHNHARADRRISA